MSGTSYLRYLEEVEIVVGRMKPLQCFVFATSCTERQWPIYERASEGRRWGKPAAIRRTLDEIWAWLSMQRKRPKGFATQCERAILDDAEDDLAEAASSVATSCYGLAAMIEEDHPQECVDAANSNLSFIESFLYDHLLDLPVINSRNDELVDSHELMSRETDHQRSDLRILERGIPTPVVVAEIRSASFGKSILGRHWYK